MSNVFDVHVTCDTWHVPSIVRTRVCHYYMDVSISYGGNKNSFQCVDPIFRYNFLFLSHFSDSILFPVTTFQRQIISICHTQPNTKLGRPYFPKKPHHNQTDTHFFSAPRQPNSTKFSMQPYFNPTKWFMQTTPAPPRPPKHHPDPPPKKKIKNKKINLINLILNQF